jgi:hypothetical protein
LSLFCNSLQGNPFDYLHAGYTANEFLDDACKAPNGHERQHGSSPYSRFDRPGRRYSQEGRAADKWWKAHERKKEAERKKQAERKKEAERQKEEEREIYAIEVKTQYKRAVNAMFDLLQNDNAGFNLVISNMAYQLDVVQNRLIEKQQPLVNAVNRLEVEKKGRGRLEGGIPQCEGVET